MTGRIEMVSEKDTYFLKLVIAGDGAVGKTSLRERFMGRAFRARYLETLGADFTTRDLDVSPGKLSGEDIDSIRLRFQIWDLAGQPKLKNVRRAYYLGAVSCLLVFDITRRDSFENLGSWLDEVWKNNGKGIIPTIILGNKNDLRDEVPDCVDEEEVLLYIKTLSERTEEKEFGIEYFNTSAKTGLNVAEAFEAIGRMFLRTLK
ncbi:MAG: Rab family GTPase [Candidatus Odinarchaeota archaeon]